MSSILIGFASHHGQTRKVAVRLGEHLRTLGHDVDLANLADGLTETPSPEDYDVVILGSRIEISRCAPSLGAYVRDHRAALGEIPTVLFTVSMSAASTDKGPDPQGYLERICTDLGWAPSLRKAIAGGLKYREYGFFTRFMMKMISRSAGRTTDTSKNHELTDWEGVRQFAGDIAGLCPRDQLEVTYADSAVAQH